MSRHGGRQHGGGVASLPPSPPACACVPLLAFWRSRHLVCLLFSCSKWQSGLPGALAQTRQMPPAPGGLAMQLVLCRADWHDFVATVVVVVCEASAEQQLPLGSTAAR